MEIFVHPWYMVAGGLLISSPILIHLINRMRFKRIRWAAMEFLLKSQKRNRRRLIIEQMILLALRCLLVALAGFLVARFVGASGAGSEGATHIVVLDDTPSMGDHWVEKGPTLTSFDVGREQIKLLARSAAQAPSHQQMRVFLLSDLQNSIFDRRLNDRSSEELHAALASRKPASVHVAPVEALKKALEIFNDVARGQKVLHFVSDFRDGDWNSGPGVEELNQTINKLTEQGIHLSLIDTAHPYRAAARQLALNHDNLAIMDLRCETHVAAEGLDTEFTVVIKNFSSTEKQSFLKVFVDGQEEFRATRPLRLAPDELKEEKFTLVLVKKKLAPPLAPGDNRDERERKRRLDQEFVHVQAVIEAEETGLQADNVRDLVVEVRKKVPTLVVDGNTAAESKQDGGDLFHLETAFAAARAYEIERCTIDELDRLQLDLYPSMIFLNVREIKSEKTLKKVQEYVRHGGSIAYFVGDKASPTFYNDTLFKKYEGLFPLLIGSAPYQVVDPRLTEEDKEQRRRDRRQNDPQPKILFPKPDHPVVATLAPYASFFRYLSIDVYHRAQERYKWEKPTNSAGKPEEIVLLPNNHDIGEYKERGQELGRLALEQTTEIAKTEENYQKFVPAVDRYKTQIRDALATPYLFNVVRALDALLKDRGPDNDPSRPDMAALWAHPRLLDLAAQIAAFRDTLLYGDPLVVSRAYGKGKVVAILTAAGTSVRGDGTARCSWNDWGGGSAVTFTYVPFLMDLQRWMTSQGDDLNRLAGDSITLQFDAAKYLPRVKRRFQPQPEPDPDARGRDTPKAEESEQPLPMTGNTLTFELSDARRPGVYFFEFFPNAKDGAAAGQTEVRAYAFNIDAGRESDLRRAARDKLERPRAGKDNKTGTVMVRAPGDNYDLYKNRKPDASESPWLYLFFLVILVVEQALAVHLSFHVRGSEAAPAAAGGSRPSPAAA
jgi:hypothetical protein